MNPRVTEVKPSANYTLLLTFTNGEVKVFDVKPYLDIGIFRELKKKGYFNAVRPLLGSIQWPNGQDFCPDTLYLNSNAYSNIIQANAVNNVSEGGAKPDPRLPKRTPMELRT